MLMVLYVHLRYHRTFALQFDHYRSTNKKPVELDLKLGSVLKTSCSFATEINNWPEKGSGNVFILWQGQSFKSRVKQAERLTTFVW